VQLGKDAAGGSTAGLSVATWVVKTSHSLIFGVVVEETRCLANDCVSICSDCLYCAGTNRFGTLCLIAQHKDRLSERGTFLLHAAGVCDEEIGSTHKINEGQVINRLAQKDV
jgi:hypothetical protein